MAAGTEEEPKVGEGAQSQGQGLAEAAALLVLQKARAIWGQRGRLIVEADRQQAIELIEEAVAGARCFRACEVLEIDVRTLQRWKRALRLAVPGDQRKAAAQVRTPGNALTPVERAEIVRVCNLPEYCSLAPTQIVPRLADAGRYLASSRAFTGSCVMPSRSIAAAPQSSPGQCRNPKAFAPQRPIRSGPGISHSRQQHPRAVLSVVHD